MPYLFQLRAINRDINQISKVSSASTPLTNSHILGQTNVSLSLPLSQKAFGRLFVESVITNNQTTQRFSETGVEEYSEQYIA